MVLQWLLGARKPAPEPEDEAPIRRPPSSDEEVDDEDDDDEGWEDEALEEGGQAALVLLFSARDRERLRVLSLQVKDVPSLDLKPEVTLAPAPRATAWSPNGSTLAAAEVAGVTVVEFPSAETLVLEGSLPGAQQLQWSPHATYLVMQCPVAADGEPNVQVWRRNGRGDYSREASFQHPKFERGLTIFQWTSDERVCCQMLADGAVQLLAGTDIVGPAVALSLAREAEAFRFAPTCATCPQGRLAVFLADSRDGMRRVTGKAEVCIFDMPDGSATSASQTVSVPIEFGQQAELHWNSTGTAVMAHCQTEVDDSGQSYYGACKLVLCSHDGQKTVDLTEDCARTAAGGNSVQAVSWSPTRDEFVLIQGFQPATATCWSWDAASRECTMIAVLHEKAHRNTIRWNHFGSMVCVAGFGNLAGEVDFFGRSKGGGLERVCSCTAACAVSSEWSPDGRHLMTAVVAPRMRVDNGFSVWCSLTGAKVAQLSFEELHEVEWRPTPQDDTRQAFVDISPEEVERAREAFATGGGAGRKAYRPPGARLRDGYGGDAVTPSGDSTFAAAVSGFMRGDNPSQPTAAELMQQDADVKQSDADAAATAEAARQQRRLDAERRLQERSLEAKKKLDAENAQSLRDFNGHGAKQPCPATGWQYKDKKGTIQGPFTLEQMNGWHNRGILKPDLQIRCAAEDRFMALRELFPHPMIPFHSCPRRPSMPSL